MLGCSFAACFETRSRGTAQSLASSPHHRRHQDRLPPPFPLRLSVGFVFQRTDLQATTGYSSVGRASDCRTSQESDGPWFDSGWPDFLGRFPSGHASLSVGRASSSQSQSQGPCHSSPPLHRRHWLAPVLSMSPRSPALLAALACRFRSRPRLPWARRVQPSIAPPCGGWQ